MMVTSVSHLRQRWGRMVEVVTKKNRPILVTRRGRNVAVFLPYETYERLLPLLEEWGEAGPYAAEEAVPM